MKFSMDYGQAVELAKAGKMMQPDHYGLGWALVSTKDGALWDRNPHTGTLLQHQEDVRCMKAAWRQIWIHEYAGFNYQISSNGDGNWEVEPLEQQHAAASKHKHIQAARETFVEEGKWKQ